MKNLMTIALVGCATFALSACETNSGHFDGEPPYALERTAEHQQATKAAPTPPPAPEPAPAPQCEPCADCSPLQTRIDSLEAELATCREASNRVRDAYQDELKK